MIFKELLEQGSIVCWHMGKIGFPEKKHNQRVNTLARISSENKHIRHKASSTLFSTLTCSYISNITNLLWFYNKNDIMKVIHIEIESFFGRKAICSIWW